MDVAPEGLRTSLNAIREEIVQGNKVYGQDIPYITDTTSISEFAVPLMNNVEAFNEWQDKLVKRIIYTGVKSRTFNNPFQDLEGETIPLGYMGQEIMTNPVRPRKFNVNDFAGLLRRYEDDTKVQYAPVNSDLQYPLTITRDKLRNAFTSWGDLNAYVESLINSVYNGAYITRYEQIKMLVANAFNTNSVQYKVVNDPTASEANAKAFIKEARKTVLNFRSPSSDYNAWAKVGGYGRAVVTWTEPQDTYMILRNDILASADVDVLAASFNMDKASFLADRVRGVDNFDIYNDEGEKIFDGEQAGIIGILCDKSFFKIHTQEFVMDDFYNINNRSRQYMLNDVRAVNFSLWSNAVVFSTKAPNTPAQSAVFTPSTATVTAGETVKLALDVKPFQTTDDVVFTSSDSTYATVAADEKNPRIAVVTGVAAGSATITATVGTGASAVTATAAITVEAAAES